MDKYGVNVGLKEIKNLQEIDLKVFYKLIYLNIIFETTFCL
jgi:hypothetical protein